MRVAVLVNPTAGRGRGMAAGAMAEQTLRARGCRVVDVRGADAAEALVAARQAVAGGDLEALLAVGGDGVVHLALQAVAGTGLPFGIAPCGTGNDIAASLGMPTTPRSAADALVDRLRAGVVRPVDLARTDTGEWCGGVTAMGFDSRVNERANRMRWPHGPRRYDVAIFAELMALQSPATVVVVDGRRYELDATLVAVGNGPRYGGGYRVTPDASMDDGLLDVLLVHAISRTALVRLLPRVRDGSHVSHRRVELLRGREVRVSCAGVVAWADGERVGPLPMTFTCIPGALSALAGADAPALSAPA